jgi:hypothetical protein
MKRTILVSLVLFAIAVISANAQISVTRDDFPQIGNLVVSAVDNTTTINPGQPGANQTWDFSNLVGTAWDSIYYISPVGAPEYQNYPTANIATNHNPLSYPNGYNINFWDFSTANLKGIADESLVNLFGDYFFAFHIKYYPASSNLDFSIDFGDSKTQDFMIDWITASRYMGVTMDSARTISHTNLACVVDAWGTIILPDGSYPALRVKETFNTIDSSFTWNGNNWSYDSDTTSNWSQYRWYANDYGEVGFYRSGSKKANGFTFFKSETLVGLEVASKQAELKIYPNPASTKINIFYDSKIESIEVSDNTGKVVITAYGQSTMDVSALAPGLYTVRISDGKNIHSAKFFRQ